MPKDASLFSSFDVSTKMNIYVVDDCSLDIVGHSDIPCRHCQIFNVYHVPSLSKKKIVGFSIDKE